jgi:hypothetical protein
MYIKEFKVEYEVHAAVLMKSSVSRDYNGALWLISQKKNSSGKQ